MKCQKCRAENKDGARNCRKCGAALEEDWQPTWAWNLKVLGVIYAFLLAFYILVKLLI